MYRTSPSQLESLAKACDRVRAKTGVRHFELSGKAILITVNAFEDLSSRRAQGEMRGIGFHRLVKDRVSHFRINWQVSPTESLLFKAQAMSSFW